LNKLMALNWLWDKIKPPTKDIKTVGSFVASKIKPPTQDFKTVSKLVLSKIKPPVKDIATIGRALPKTTSPLDAIRKMVINPPQKFFKPTEDVRLRDVARELPDVFGGTLKAVTVDIPQEIARYSGGGIGMSLLNLFADIKDPSGKSRRMEYQPTKDDPVIERAMKLFIFGKKPVKPSEQLIVDAGNWVAEQGEKGTWEVGKYRKDAPWFENLTRSGVMGALEKHPMIAGMIAVPLITALDFTGFGGAGKAGAKNFFKYLSKADDVADVAKGMRQVGVAEDIIKATAPDIAKLKNPLEIEKAFTKIDLLQKSTKVSPIRQSDKALEVMRKPKEIIETKYFEQYKNITDKVSDIYSIPKIKIEISPEKYATGMGKAKFSIKTVKIAGKVVSEEPKITIYGSGEANVSDLAHELSHYIDYAKGDKNVLDNIIGHGAKHEGKQYDLIKWLNANKEKYPLQSKLELSKPTPTSKPLPKPSPLIQEAKKYKTADEFSKSFTIERGARGGMDISSGEAGRGVYAYIKNPKMKAYYTKEGETLLKIKPKEGTEIIDLTKEYDDLISFVKKKIDETAKEMEFYVKPKVNKNNVQQFGSSVQEYVYKNYPDASAYIVGHKGFGIPTGKQVVITKPENFISQTKSQLIDIWNKAQVAPEAQKGVYTKLLDKKGIIAPAKRLDEVQAIQKKQIAPAKTPDKKAIATKEPLKRKLDVSSDLVKEIKKSGNINKVLSYPKKEYSKLPKLSSIKDAKSFKKFKDNVSSVWTNIREMVEDDWVRVKKLVQRDDVKVSEMSDPYSAEILMHGRVGTRVEGAKEVVKSIDKDILKLSKQTKKSSDIISGDVDRYLIARHAPERNFALGDGAAGITTKEAKAVLKEIESLPEGKEIIKIADRMQDLNNKTLDVLLEGEVIDQKLFNTLRNKYKNHIPLNRVMEDTDDIGSAIAGRPYDVRSTGILKAKGSEREVADVMTNITNNYEQAIIRAEKNRVDLATLQFARDNKHLGLFNEIKPKAIGKTFDDKFILERIDDPTVLVLREKGKPVYLKIEDPNLAVALRGVNRWKVDGVMKGIQSITRFYSQLATRFNIDFPLPNKIRDLQEAIVYMISKKEFGFKGAAKAATEDIKGKNMKAVMDYIRGIDSEGAKLYNQMRLDGGTTGGLGLSTRKKIELDIESIRKINRSNPRKAAEKIVETVDNLNQVFEDSTRLSIYKEALEKGVSRKRAAVLAKEGTINFNKFGKGGPVINAMYMFSNASIQGSAKMLRAMRNPKVAGVVITVVGTAVASTNEWNDKVDPGWRDKVSKWDRMNSLPIVIPTKDGGITYISIPVSWGIKPIKVSMDYASDIMAGKGTITDAMSGVLASVMEGYNPIGGTDLLSAAMPTIFDMPVEIARNQGWHGGSIRPDWDKNAPASIQYFDSLKDNITGRTMIGFSKGLSGVGIEMSPANMKYAYEALVGGAGRFTSKVLNTISAVGKQEAPEIRDIPVISRFLKERKEEQVGAGSKKYESLKKVLQEQSRDRFVLAQQAEDSYNQLKNIPKEEAKEMFAKIIEDDPSLAKKINEIIKEEELGLNYIDRLTKQLGVENGERAKFIVGELNKLKTKEEKKNYYQEMIDKKIISKEVGRQIIEMLK